MPDRDLMLFVPCQAPVRPERLCGRPPVGVHLPTGLCLCAHHFAELRQPGVLPDANEVIEGAYAVLRATWHPPFDSASS